MFAEAGPALGHGATPHPGAPSTPGQMRPEPPAPVRLRVHRLALHRAGRILADLSFEVRAGEILAVVGPSGCGKSTLLQVLAGLVPCDAGRIEVDAVDISNRPAQQRPTGLVFQSGALFQHMTVRDNIAFGLDGSNLSPRHRADLVDATMARMGVADLARRRPHQLSGGQSQRVALARTLVRRPPVLLLDEPLAHVGAAVASSIRAALVREVGRLGSSVLYVTHDVEEACLVADRIMLLDQGRCLQIGASRELYARPASPEAAHLMGIPNILAATVESVATSCPDGSGAAGDRSDVIALVRCGTAAFHLAAGPGVARGPALVSIPPEDIEMHRAPAHSVIGRHGQVIGASFVRSHMSYDVETQMGTLVVRHPDTSSPFDVGAHVDVEFRGGWVLPSAR
ncbi:ABC transporter ATP-binding protein [Schaalia sp. 19OD2882]|uniref:ABC transporter ATP-binding protein n=1 Tax=Schaalia sp. 19OD2882 TaxID=2794089 RepID=UPI001C1EC7F6|nr:ABC transporter ATP-binding protein [Schaalia sp. 19OD2882]QWW19742.1 ABC transporter ATP-binding protein [Schaalia sp. 19OD2882]